MKLKIQLAEEELELAGLIDSGNQLYDPLTKTPVMIMHISSLEHCLPAVNRTNLFQNRDSSNTRK